MFYIQNSWESILNLDLLFGTGEKFLLLDICCQRYRLLGVMIGIKESMKSIVHFGPF